MMSLKVLLGVHTSRRLQVRRGQMPLLWTPFQQGGDIGADCGSWMRWSISGRLPDMLLAFGFWTGNLDRLGCVKQRRSVILTK
jgi:hypothetical protein